jgi:hypothetical protein
MNRDLFLLGTFQVRTARLLLSAACLRHQWIECACMDTEADKGEKACASTERVLKNNHGGTTVDVGDVYSSKSS